MKTYVEKRQIVIDRTLKLVKEIYGKDQEMSSGVIDLTVNLEMAEPNDDFIHGMLGFLNWCDAHSGETGDGWILNTLIHDLGEFSRYRDKNWFCPRTSSYIKYALEYVD